MSQQGTPGAMAVLRERFLQLSPSQKVRVQLSLCHHALTVWQQFHDTRGAVSYVDSVVGGWHALDAQLPVDALVLIESGEDLSPVLLRFQEPIVALQDEDLELPDHIRYALYAIYNLTVQESGTRSVDAWLVVNQALAAERNSRQWVPHLRQAIERASLQGS